MASARAGIQRRCRPARRALCLRHRARLVPPGHSWQTSPLPPSLKGSPSDLNLFGLFAGRQGEVYATAEQGRVLRSADGGATWGVLDTGYRGSLWAGLALKDGSLLVGGLRGTLMKSRDGGSRWLTLPSAGRSSITGLAQAADRRLVASALDGVALVGGEDGPFEVRQAPERFAFTAVLVDRAGSPVLMSRAGPRIELP